jgi:YVTN family beta-propeller protein
VSSYSLGVVYADGDVEPTAEIVAHDPNTQRLFVTSAVSSSISILDVSDPTNPTTFGEISLGGEPNSVAVYSNTVAVALAAAPEQDPGTVEFYDTAGNSKGSPVTVGALPDMVTFTPDGDYVLVANEGEPSDDYLTDPDGSISIIDVSGGFTSPPVSTATFDSFTVAGLADTDVRIFPTDDVAQNVEPEYIAVSPDSSTAYVTLQENNAVAVVDVDTATVSAIVGLGFKDYLLEENALDASNEDGAGGDGAINIRNWPVKGMYQPDAIATFESGDCQRRRRPRL